MLDQFKFVGKKLFEEGLISSHAGHMSIRKADKIYITRALSMLSELKEEDIIEVSLDKEGENDKEASVELPVHRAIYLKTKVQAIIHARPTEAIALSFQEEKIYPQDSEGRLNMRTIPVVRTRESINSPDAIKQLPAIFNGGYNAAMVKAHGSFAVGADLVEAYKYTSVLASSCKIIAVQKSIAKPQPSTQHQQRGGPRNSPRSGQRSGQRSFRGKSAIPEGIGIMGRRAPYRKR